MSDECWKTAPEEFKKWLKEQEEKELKEHYSMTKLILENSLLHNHLKQTQEDHAEESACVADLTNKNAQLRAAICVALDWFVRQGVSNSLGANVLRAALKDK